MTDPTQTIPDLPSGGPELVEQIRRHLTTFIADDTPANVAEELQALIGPHLPGPGPDREALRDRIAEALTQWTLNAAGATSALLPRDMAILRTNSEARADAVMGPVRDEIDALTERATDAEKRAASYENAINWGTSCLGCAKAADTLHTIESEAEVDRAHLQAIGDGWKERAERAEAAVQRVRDAHPMTTWTRPDGSQFQYCEACCDTEVYAGPCATLAALDQPEPLQGHA